MTKALIAVIGSKHLAAAVLRALPNLGVTARAIRAVE